MFKKIRRVYLLWASLTVTFSLNCVDKNPAAPWPTIGWQLSSPAEEGISYDSLKEFSDQLKSGDLGYIDGMLVIRNGKIIFEDSYKNNYDSLYKATNTKPGQYNYYDSQWHPYYNKTELHTMQSISKSFTAAAIGIAIKNGHIEGVDVPIKNYLKEYESAFNDKKKQEITIKDALTMRAGIEWDELSMPYTDTTSSCVEMEASEDWIQYVLDQPIIYEPGEKWEYSSGVTMLLSKIILEATGENVSDYLEKELFNKIGINNYFWKQTPKGLTDAEGGLYLEPRDLAKFGYLYLNNGLWDGNKILPKDWVKNNSAELIDTIWPAFKYGQQWWFIPYNKDNIAWLASGLGGQRLLIIPEFDIIAVFTGWNVYETTALSSYLALQKVLESVQK